MDDSEIIAAVRFAAGIPDAHPDYTDARIRTEINDTLQTVFGRSVIHSQGGYWKHYETQDLVAGTAHYQIPQRALVGGLKAVEVRPTGSDDYYPLEELTPEELAQRDTKSGRPRRYDLQGDFLRLMPNPDSSSADLRCWYYLRPPKLVQEQTTAGIITSINTTTRVALMATTPTDRVTAAAITSSSVVDVVSPTGTHEVHVVGASLDDVTTDTSVTFASGTDLSRVKVGDAVRAADQTDWPCLPQEFHRTLADAAAAVMLAGGIGAIQKAGGLSGKVVNDLERFEDMIQPRVKDAVRRLRPRYGALRHGRAGYRRFWPVASSS